MFSFKMIQINILTWYVQLKTDNNLSIIIDIVCIIDTTMNFIPQVLICILVSEYNVIINNKYL